MLDSLTATRESSCESYQKTQHRALLGSIATTLATKMHEETARLASSPSGVNLLKAGPGGDNGNLCESFAAFTRPQQCNQRDNFFLTFMMQSSL